MATLGIRQTTWQALSVRDRTIFRFVGEVLALGVPAQFRDGASDIWFVFDDHRFEPRHVAYFGCLAANVNEIPAGYVVPMVDILDRNGNPTGEQEPENRPKLIQDIKQFCENPARTNPLVLPADVVFPENDSNPWQTLLDAQGTPATMKMGSGVPANWTPYSPIAMSP